MWQPVSTADPMCSSLICQDGRPPARAPRGCPGPRGPQGPAGPQPPLSDAVDSDAQDVAASSRAVNTLRNSTRVRLASPLTLHVRLDGDDARDGLGEATAKQTLSGALRELQHYDAGNTTTTIRFGPGEFDSGAPLLDAPALHGHPRLQLVGAGRQATLLHNNQEHYLLRVWRTEVRLSEMSLRGEVYAGQHGLLRLADLTLEATRSEYFLLNAQLSGLLWVVGDIAVSGNCNGLVYASKGGCVLVDSSGSVTLLNTPAYANCVALARDGAVLWEGPVTGSCTGVRFRQVGKGTVSSGYASPNEVIPGTMDGA